MKYSITNLHSKWVMMPGGKLLPGVTSVYDLTDKEHDLLSRSKFIEIKKVAVIKKKKAKK